MVVFVPVFLLLDSFWPTYIGCLKCADMINHLSSTISCVNHPL